MRGEQDYDVQYVSSCEPRCRGGLEERNGWSMCARTGYESTKKAERNSTQREMSLERDPSQIIRWWFGLNYFLVITGARWY